MDFMLRLFTGRDNASADIGRVLFALAAFSDIALEVFSVVVRHAPFDAVSFGTSVGALLVSGGAGLALKARTEPHPAP